ncbi:hypothetical protein [Spirosoma arcticum]
MALSGPAKAQLVWHKGELTLVTSIRLTGELCYQSQANALLFRMAGKWRVYQPYELHRFRYTDSTTNRVRTFAPYEILRKNGDTQSVIFEELIGGGRRATTRTIRSVRREADPRVSVASYP